MRSAIFSICLLFGAAAAFISCKKEINESQQNGISLEVLSKIKAQGFGTNNIQKIDEGYLVEGDIVLTDAYLSHSPDNKKIIIANEEQYRTTNTVSTSSGVRVITVSISGNVNQAFSDALDHAIARYDAENLLLDFERVASGGNIIIRLVNTGQYIASAGFPDSQGNPYPEIKYAKRYANYSDGFMTTVLSHELGHCIGFRHTDYMNRAFSCGTGGNEGAGSVGAIHIDGTPTGPESDSWMLACLGSTTNRPFTSNDKKALDFLY